MRIRHRELSVACVLAVTGGALAPASACAEVAVMVPPLIDQTIGADVSEAALEELSRLLRDADLEVVPPNEASTLAEAEQQRGRFPEAYDPMYCITPQCAHAYRKLYPGEAFAVQLTIGSRDGYPSDVSVVLTADEHSPFRGSAPLAEVDVRKAIRSAFAIARERQRAGAGPWLVVSGEPEGATVYLDQEEVGKLPIHKLRIAPGVHRVEARADERISDIRTLDVSTDSEQVYALDVALKPLRPGQPPSFPRESRIHRSAWDWAIGGIASAAGTASLVAGFYKKSQQQTGDCSERVEGMCTERGDAGPGRRENLMIGLGAAGLAAGALVMGLGPVGSFSFRAGTEHTSLQFKRAF